MDSELGTNIDQEPIKIRKAAKPIPRPDTVRIILEEDDNIPPTGLFVGVNGKGYLIAPGEVVDVPQSVVEVLDHAVMATPQLDPATKQVAGYRERMRYAYRRVA